MGRSAELSSETYHALVGSRTHGPAKETKMEAPHSAAAFRRDSSLNSPWIAMAFVCSKMDFGSLETLRAKMVSLCPSCSAASQKARPEGPRYIVSRGDTGRAQRSYP